VAESEFWPNGARLAITMSLMFESGGEVRPDSGALGPLFPIPMPLEIPDLPTETYFQYGYLEGIGAEQLALMKRSAVLLNTSRGAVVDEPALAGALEKDQIASGRTRCFRGRAARDGQSAAPPGRQGSALTPHDCLQRWQRPEARHCLVDAIRVERAAGRGA